MGDCIDADMEADKDSALVDVCDRSGIFTLNFALAQVFLAGVAACALNICLHGDVFEGMDLDAQDADKDLFANMEAFRGIPQPVPRQVAGKDGTFRTENLHADHLFCDGNDSRLYDAVFAHAGVSIGIRKVKNLPLFIHGILPACHHAAAGIVKSLDDEAAVKNKL